jgi:hypothetical protein
MKLDRLNILLVSCPPRGLSRLQAAVYIGISAPLFDQMVNDGRMPRKSASDEPAPESWA